MIMREVYPPFSIAHSSLFITMCINCIKSGFHTESINQTSLSERVLSTNEQEKQEDLAKNLVDPLWVNYIKHPENGFVNDGKIDIHVDKSIPKKIGKYAKAMVRRIDKLTGMDIKLTRNKNKADILVDDVKDYDDFSGDMSNVNGLAFVRDGKLNATWLEDSNHTFTNRKGKTKVWNYTRRLITHEILHTLGISHPYGDGNTKGFDNTDTAMSYNFTDYGIKNPLRPADVSALQLIWGV